MSPQLLRLLIITVVVGATYAVARFLLTPDTFGQYGHFRGAALEESARRTPLYAGAKACDECHSDTSEVLVKAPHKLISCEACHGPSSAHVRNPELTTIKLTDESCLRCHVADPARPQKHKQVTRLEHYPPDGCTECHWPHEPNKSP
jgi:hypothetical protein